MKNLKFFRAEAGLTQKELAEKIGITRISIINLESNATKIANPETTKKLCELFHTTPFLLYGIDNLSYLPTNMEEVNYLVEQLKEVINNEN